MTKRILNLLTLLVMAVSLTGVLPAFSASAETSGDYEYTILGDGTVKITGYNGSASTLNIPSTIDGKAVTSIGEGAFEESELITSVIIPNSVTSIGDWAFVFSSLTSVTIGNSVTSIGEGAFRNCNLTGVTIPNSVISIGEQAFDDCDRLTNATIGNNVTSIGGFAFNGCNLKSITIPNSVTSIGYYAFSACGLTSITIPKSVTYIGEYAIGYDFDWDIEEYVKTKDYKIYCYEGTAGEEYAIENGFDYEFANNNPNNNSTKPNQTATPINNTKTTPSTTKVSVTKPAKVKSVNLTAKKKKLNVKWKKVSGATGYEVMYAKNNKFTKGNKTVKVKKNKVTLKRLKSKKKYFVKVRAYKTVNGNTSYGKWSKVAKKKVK